MVSPLCCGGYFSNITFIDVKTKYRSPYLLDVSQSYLQNHIRTSLGRPHDDSEGRPQDVSRTRLLELSIRLYGHVFITSTGDVLKTLVGDIPWRYIQDSMGTCSGRYIETSSGRHISTSSGSRQRTSLAPRQGTSLVVTKTDIRGCPQDVFWRSSLGRRQDVILPSGNLYPNEYSQEFHYYSFDVNLDRCVERCNTFNSLSNKICVANKTEEINLSMLNMIARKNESKTLTKHMLCECNCRSDGRNVIQINGQWWNNDKC